MCTEYWHVHLRHPNTHAPSHHENTVVSKLLFLKAGWLPVWATDLRAADVLAHSRPIASRASMAGRDFWRALQERRGEQMVACVVCNALTRRSEALLRTGAEAVAPLCHPCCEATLVGGMHVVIVAVVANRCVVMATRSPGKAYAGCWEVPGGKVNTLEGELPAQAHGRWIGGGELQRERERLILDRHARRWGRLG